MHSSEQTILVALLAVISILVVGALIAAVLLLLWIRRFIAKMQVLHAAVSDVPGTLKNYGKRAGILNVVKLLVKLI